MSATINEISCNPEQAEWIYASPAGSDCFTHDGFRRFDEVLFRGPDGFFFLVRPLAPDEAKQWLENWRHDHLLARRLFPDRGQS